jgi:hypothetical protein
LPKSPSKNRCAYVIARLSDASQHKINPASIAGQLRTSVYFSFP